MLGKVSGRVPESKASLEEVEAHERVLLKEQQSSRPVLQVKCSPLAQPTPPINDDPAIIQCLTILTQLTQYYGPATGLPCMHQHSVCTEAPVPSLVTPGQLLQSGPAAVSSPQLSQAFHKDVEVVPVQASSSEVLVLVLAEAQPPILPLPTPARAGRSKVYDCWLLWGVVKLKGLEGLKIELSLCRVHVR
ncbi:hypothetical protein TorRG33x02_316870 [Trema orientale]|uniref:Uncharacterized protein n=1 Tax=Trema orientale TaxID=63057 RepID=A0A2P5BLG9_TREOI|nr:hypothetical protein TorRG33x02_316870 [Trema orientale]